MQAKSVEVVTIPMDTLMENMKQRLERRPGTTARVLEYGLTDDKLSLWFRMEIIVEAKLPDNKEARH